VTNILAPFLIGLAGSLHCIGMCSPLVAAVSKTGRNAIFRNLLYNLGRILTYGLLGSIISFAGRGLHISGLQQWVSITAGIVMLFIVLINIRVGMPAFMQRFVLRLTGSLKNQFRQTLHNRNEFSVVLLGMINGLLPCGMTLIAMGYCITLPGPWSGFLAMLLFGLGTLPAMVGFTAVIKTIVSMLKIRYSTLQSGLIIACAILLIGRGIWSDSDSGDHVAGKPGIVICGNADER
jgi:sulfite exporter TauE/SafE